MKRADTSNIKKVVRNWLFIGVVMVFIQVVVGGVTRLTDSGLSITEWSIIQGTIPPLNEVEWQEAFEMYKVAAKKQYETLHADMTLGEFKYIFFWEYIHRLWARLIGFVFLFPFIFFLIKKWIPRWLLRDLLIVVFLAACEATFGWIMVSSGLNDDKRTWVSAYKLIIHLGVATILFGYLFWTWLKARPKYQTMPNQLSLKRFSWIITIVLFIQIVFGGLMAGMRAGLVHPHFPFFIQSEGFYKALQNTQELQAVIDYEPSSFIKALVQVLHRSTAYLLVILIILYARNAFKNAITDHAKRIITILLIVLGGQFLLGVLTIINSIGRIPITYGALHQGVALILLAVLLMNNYQYVKSK